MIWKAWLPAARLRLWGGLFLGVVVAGVAAAAIYLQHWWTSPLPVDEGLTVVVREGDSVADLAKRMRDADLLEHPRLLRWMTGLHGFAGALQVGEYAVRYGDTPERLISRIVAGKVVSYQFRMLEGARIAGVLADLRAQPKIRQTLNGVDARGLLTILGVDEELRTSHGEGWFFPDTYLYVAGDEDRALLIRAHRKMRRELSAVWESKAEGLPYRTPYEALVAASIVEKETALASDRAHVSQVIVARLGKDMPLQMDPTVIYGLGDAFDGNLTRTHLESPTAYNTYVHRGLPPTPIGLPGREALRAAVNPSGSPYLYFVSRGDGSSEFSTTLEEHLAAVRRYRP